MSDKPASSPNTKNLDVNRVVLFKHGVACLYRSGWISNEPQEVEKQTFYLPAKSMNDCLKSISITDAATGQAISSISFQSSPLASINTTLAAALDYQFLNHLRGSRVCITFQENSATHQGILLGSSVTSNFGSGQQMDISIFTDDSLYLTIPLDKIQELKFLDTELNHEIKNLCALTTAQRTSGSIPINLYDTRPGPEIYRTQVNVQYTIESPVWKNTYRILLPSHLIKNQKSATIECWGIVDNQTAEDWKEVQVSLVSGLSLSFTQDVYSLKTYQRPQLTNDANGETWTQNAAAAAGDGKVNLFQTEQPPQFGYNNNNNNNAHNRKGYRKDWTQHTASKAEALRTGKSREVFEYDVENKVTVPRGQSALVPVFKVPFSGRRILIFNQIVQEKHPLIAVLLSNDTNKFLAGGAATIYEDGKYIGESLLEDIRQDQEVVIPYAVENKCVVKKWNKKEDLGVQRVTVAETKLSLFETCVMTTNYTIENKSSQELAEVFLEHQAQTGSGFMSRNPDLLPPGQTSSSFNVSDNNWVLETTANLIRKSQNTSEVPYHRFSLTNIAPQKTLKFQVVETQLRKSTINLATIDRGTIDYWSSSRKEYIDDHTTSELKACISLVEEFKSRRRYMLTLEQEINNLYQRQIQIRRDLQSRGVILGDGGLLGAHPAGISAGDASALSNIDEMIARIETEVTALKQQESQKEEIWKTKLKSLSCEKIFERKETEGKGIPKQDSISFSSCFPSEVAQLEEERRKMRNAPQPCSGFSFPVRSVESTQSSFSTPPSFGSSSAAPSVSSSTGTSFTSSTPSPFGFGAATGSSFGSSNTSNVPTTTSNAFGIATILPPTTSFSFGATPTVLPPTTSPATASFGQPPTTSTPLAFGSTTPSTASTSSFGQPSPTSFGFSFGGQPATTTTPFGGQSAPASNFTDNNKADLSALLTLIDKTPVPKPTE